MLTSIASIISSFVALRKESVDRNKIIKENVASVNQVALRKESVDRNTPGTDTSAGQNRSLSARRAWIEMAAAQLAMLLVVTSLSARRAWIEILEGRCLNMQRNVALRKESVDRNCGQLVLYCP